MDLDYNRIEKIAGLFKFIKKLREIYLVYNRIMVLDPSLIQNLAKLTHLDLENNDCNNFNETDSSLTKSTFAPHTSNCTEENSCEYKLQKKTKENSQLNRTIRKIKLSEKYLKSTNAKLTALIIKKLER